jgi:hypothetical protein
MAIEALSGSRSQQPRNQDPADLAVVRQLQRHEMIDGIVRAHRRAGRLRVMGGHAPVPMSMRRDYEAHILTCPQ